jgi:hypothetical protein
MGVFGGMSSEQRKSIPLWVVLTGTFVGFASLYRALLFGFGSTCSSPMLSGDGPADPAPCVSSSFVEPWAPPLLCLGLLLLAGVFAWSIAEVRRARADRRQRDP